MVWNNTNHNYKWTQKIDLLYIKLNLENKETLQMKIIMK